MKVSETASQPQWLHRHPTGCGLSHPCLCARWIPPPKETAHAHLKSARKDGWQTGYGEELDRIEMDS
jgi:hypothetical protein